MPEYYPPVGFHFRVEVLNLSPETKIQDDGRFTEVGGLAFEMATEEVAEGGENRFVQKYPTRTKYPELVLKRGLFANSEVLKWIRRCIQDYDIQPRDIDVQLLNENHEPLVTWHISKAYPTKWSVSDLNASNNAVAIETLQLFYQRFTIETK